MKASKKTLYTVIVALFFFAVTEGSIRLIRSMRPFPLASMTALTCQHSYFRDHVYEPNAPLIPGEKFFDPHVGWRNGLGGAAIRHGYQVNAQGFRSPYDFNQPKSRPRVALVGDSFTFGSGLKNDQTIATHLSKYLGNKYDVMNFGVEGFSVVQMALLASDAVAQYKPDALIVAFIGDDLLRSCRSCHAAIKLPGLKREGDKIVGTGVPIESPISLQEKRNHSIFERLRDSFIARLRSSHVVAVAAEIPYLRWHENCVRERNLLAIEKIETEFSGIPVVFTHLEGPMPSAIEEHLKSKVRNFIPMANLEKGISEKTGLKLDTSDRYHPGPDRAQILAMVYADIVKKLMKPKNLAAR